MTLVLGTGFKFLVAAYACVSYGRIPDVERSSMLTFRSIFHVDSKKNIVFDENATEGRWQDNNLSVQLLFKPN